MDLRRLPVAVLTSTLTLGLTSVLAAGVVDPASADAAPVAACTEPGGQTDTPPHPRLVRAQVEDVAVAVVLPVGYARHPGRRYPVVYLMHGAQGDEDGWIEYGGLLAETAKRPAHQQAIVVMPRMGVVTGLATDWVDGSRKDATLVGRTLVRWTDARFRTRSDRRHRAIAGYSGGGLSATHVAERFPTVFGQLGVLSAPVDLSDPVNQVAAWGAFEAEKLCAGGDPLSAGPLGSPVTHPEAWAAFDPLAHAGRLARTTVWLSSGNGVPCSPADAANLVYPTAAAEPQMRTQLTAFGAALADAGVRHHHQRRSCGLHWWTTWRPALRDFWDVAARRWPA